VDGEDKVELKPAVGKEVKKDKKGCSMMEMNTILGIKEEVVNLEPDIGCKIEGNKEKVFKIYAGNDFDEGEKKLEDLLFDAYHYFDVGYGCKFTPEGLREEIGKEIDNLVEKKKKGK
jgi:hypothetical protein